MADLTNNISSNITGLWISTALDTPVWKEIVCGTDVSLDGSADITTTSTKCGTAKSKGSMSWSMSGSGVANHSPDSDELSADELIEIAQGTAQVLIRWQDNTTPANFYRSSTAHITAYTENAPEGGTVEFDFTAELQGNIDLTPAA